MSQFRNLKRKIDQIFELYPVTPAADEEHQTSIMDVGVVIEPNIPKHVWGVLVQALGEDIRYTIDGTDPTPTSGFRLTNGNDPIQIPIVGGRTVLKFIPEGADAQLELMWTE